MRIAHVHSRAATLIACPRVLAVAVMCALMPSFAHAQPCFQPTCDPIQCSTFCVVECQDELAAALACMAQGSGCTHIIVPQGAVLRLCDGIELGPEHNGLHLTINGTLMYAGPPGTALSNIPTVIRIDSASNITVDGTGVITTRFIACQDWNAQFECLEANPNAEVFPADGIIIFDSQHTTISGLRFTNLANVIKTAFADDVNLLNLTTHAHTQYGVYTDTSDDVLISNCNFHGAYGQHGIRSYSDGVTILNCSSQGAGSTGFWMVAGQNIYIDGFISYDRWCRLGPNPEGDWPEARLRCVEVRNVQIVGTDVDDKLAIEQGVIGCWLDGITTQNSESVSIGLASQTWLRPVNRVHWGTLSGSCGLSDHPCVGEDIGGCTGDVDDDGRVDVSDLLAIVASWGSCAPNSFTCFTAPNPCQADIHPVMCGNALVNVDDLVTVVSQWGCGGFQPPK